MTGWRYAGLNMAFFLGGLMGIPTDSIEASIIDGANYWQKLRYIYIPQIYSFYCHGNGNMPDRFFQPD